MPLALWTPSSIHPHSTHLPRSSRIAFRLLLLMGVSVLPNMPCMWAGKRRGRGGTASGGKGKGGRATVQLTHCTSPPAMAARQPASPGFRTQLAAAHLEVCGGGRRLQRPRPRQPWRTRCLHHNHPLTLRLLLLASLLLRRCYRCCCCRYLYVQRCCCRVRGASARSHAQRRGLLGTLLRRTAVHAPAAAAAVCMQGQCGVSSQRAVGWWSPPQQGCNLCTPASRHTPPCPPDEVQQLLRVAAATITATATLLQLPCLLLLRISRLLAPRGRRSNQRGQRAQHGV